MAEYINRERARFEAKRYFKNIKEIQEDLDMLFCMLPAENVSSVRHGRWIWRNKWEPFEFKYECSICHDGSDLESKYCQNCGARMDGGAE
jgi:hypothetical protein